MLRRLRNQRSFFGTKQSITSDTSVSLARIDETHYHDDDSLTIPSLEGATISDHGDGSSISSCSLSISPSFLKRNPDLSYDDFDDVNFKSFSRSISLADFDPDDDDISIYSYSSRNQRDSAERETLFQQIQYLENKLQDVEMSKQELLKQCLKLQKSVARNQAAPTYLNILKKENEKLKAINEQLERDFSRDVDDLLTKMSAMDLKLAERDETIADLEFELNLRWTEFS